MFRPRLLPAAFSVREKIVNDPRVVTVDPATISAILVGRHSTLKAKCLPYLDFLEPVVGALRLCPRHTQVVSFEPEGGGNE